MPPVGEDREVSIAAHLGEGRTWQVAALLEQGVGGSALKSLSPVSKNAPHSRCSVKRVRGEKSGQVLYHMYKEGGGA